MKAKRTLILIIIFIAAGLSLTFYLFNIFKPQEKAKAKVAIVIDDWGYNLRCVDLLKQIDIPVTLSILPNLRYSSKIVQEAKRLKKKTILHLPLQPQRQGRNIGLEKHTISSGMSDDEIIDKFRLALSSTSGVLGVSNHMGSYATTDTRLMSVIFSELKKRKLFFLDNMVTNKSICRELAQKMKVRFAARDFFLDNADNYEYIKGQLEKLSEFALASGSGIAIGHARPQTLKALQEMVPQMQEKGIAFVFVSDLVK